MLSPVLPKLDPAKSLFDVLSASIATAGGAVVTTTAPVAEEVVKPKRKAKKIA
jgi:hypothetical protein